MNTSNVQMEDSKFISNNAAASGGNGGAVYAIGSSVTVAGTGVSTLSNNAAAADGGAIWINNCYHFFVTGTAPVFSGNTASKKVTPDHSHGTLTKFFNNDDINHTAQQSNPSPTLEPFINDGEHYPYIFGYEDGAMHPESYITRQEVSAVFYRLMTKESRATFRKTSSSFPDVSGWALTAVATLQNAGLVKGYEDGLFRPDRPITRAEFAMITIRLGTNYQDIQSTFSDVSGHWAEKEIGYAAANGWVKGYGDGTFKPDQLISRSEAVTMINRILQRNVDESGIMNEIVTNWPDVQKSHWAYYDIMEASCSHTYKRRSTQATVEDWTGKGSLIDFDME